MLSTELNIIPESTIYLGQLIILPSQTSNLLISLIHLIYPQPVSILSLTQGLSQIIIPHYFSLGRLMIVQRFGLKLF